MAKKTKGMAEANVNEIIVVPAKTRVTKTYFGHEEIKDETLDITVFITPPAIVSIKAGCTVNLGNYESGRVDVLISIPCYKEEVEDIYPRVKQLVDDRMKEEYAELKKAAGV